LGRARRRRSSDPSFSSQAFKGEAVSAVIR
jgi:hypothetical protein